MRPFVAIGALVGGLGTFFSNLVAPPQPAPVVRVEVRLETLANRSPRVGWYDGSLTRANTLSGVDGFLPIGASTFAFSPFERDPSVGIARVPASLAFSFTVPDESTTHYEMRISRKDPAQREVALVKYVPSNFPETVLAKLFIQDGAGRVLHRDPHSTPDRGYRPNDWVHSWDCSISHTPPSQAQPADLYVVHLREQPLEAYFDDPQMQAIARAIQDHTLRPADLDAVPVTAAEHASAKGVTLLHWAVRFQNKVFVRWFLDRKLTLAPLADAQGSPIVMATRWSDPEPLVGLVKLHHARGGSFRPLELPYLIDGRQDAVPLFQALKDCGLLSVHGVRHTLIHHLQMKLAYHAEVSTVATQKLHAYMPLMTREELYPMPGEFSVAEDTLADLVRAMSLLAYYQQHKRYADRIPHEKQKVESLQSELKRLIALGSPVTPSGVCKVIDEHFFTDRGSPLDTRRPVESVTKTALLWPELFTSETAYEAFWQYVATHPAAKYEIGEISFAKRGSASDELSALRAAALAGNAPKVQAAGPFRFEVSGGHLKMSGIGGKPH